MYVAIRAKVRPSDLKDVLHPLKQLVAPPKICFTNNYIIRYKVLIKMGYILREGEYITNTN